MTIPITPATPHDLPALAPLVRAFHAEAHIPSSQLQQDALAHLLHNPELGAVYLLHHHGQIAGYFVLTFGYSLERGGKTALLDELYVIPAARNQGLGRAALAHAAACARTARCHALHLEVDHCNEKARTLYQRTGFIELPRGYLTLTL